MVTNTMRGGQRGRAIAALSLAAATMAVAPRPASAADLGGAPPPAWGPSAASAPRADSWTGFYLGATYGYASGTTSVDNAGTGFDLGQSGGIGTVLGGFNYQAGRAVFGMEVDVGGLGNHGGSAGLGTGTVTSDLNWTASVRGRAGLLMSPALLIYATGGVAWADFDVTSNGIKVAQTFSGYQLGGGAELKIDPRWSLRLEYLYTGLGAEQINHGGQFNTYEPDLHTVRAGLSFKF